MIDILNDIVKYIFILVAILKAILVIVGIFFTRKFKPAKNKHKYGIVIAARNEEKVIGNLIDSIKKQDYPKELLTIFVVADNCTDNTAKIAKKSGAIVYERFDNLHKTKGYALKYLFEKIEKNYKTNSFDGFFVFDADNLLKKDFISKMNDAFDSGSKIITSYRNTKNFNDNWISATYALHWLRSIRVAHRARSVLRLATNIQGTGFLFSNEIVKNGWKYTSLTEDRALTADAVAQGYEITYQNEAELYDEQPNNLTIAFRQRTRWSKGHIEAFIESGPYLLLNIFLGKKFIKTKWKNIEKKKTFKEALIESLRHRIASFDTLIQLTPISIFSLLNWIIFTLISFSIFSYKNGINNTILINNFGYYLKYFLLIFKININVNQGVNAIKYAIIFSIIYRIIYLISIYLSNMITAIYVFISEKNKIKKTSFTQKIKYILLWPTFDMIGRITNFIALFKKVTWKEIPHINNIKIEDLNN